MAENTCEGRMNGQRSTFGQEYDGHRPKIWETDKYSPYTQKHKNYVLKYKNYKI